MATKWKNMYEKFIQFLGREGKIISGLTSVAVGLAGLWIMSAYGGYHSPQATFLIGAQGNMWLGVGVSILLKLYLVHQYGEPEDCAGYEYEKWKTVREKSIKRLYWIGAAAGLSATVYLLFFELVYAGWSYESKFWYNYGVAYMIFMTVPTQYLICRNRLSRFWNRKLEGIMGQIEMMQQKRLAEALEIEKKSLEKVSRSDQLRVDLITNVSHDLKTPLTSIVGYIELIKKEELSGIVRDYVDVISSRTEKLGEMINSLFSLAKASSGNVELHREHFEVNRLIEQIFADMDDRIKESGLKFVTLLTKENTEIYTDNTYFYRICQNLIENALKYSAEKTRVFVKTEIRRDEGSKAAAEQSVYLADAQDSPSAPVRTEPIEEPRRRIRIEITNTAGYFMDFTKEDIVERFARGDQSRTSEGNGLGLAIVSTYAKALGGEFDIRIDCDQFKACLEFCI